MRAPTPQDAVATPAALADRQRRTHATDEHRLHVGLLDIPSTRRRATTIVVGHGLRRSFGRARASEDLYAGAECHRARATVVLEQRADREHAATLHERNRCSSRYV